MLRNLGEGGDFLMPMAIAGIGGLVMEIAVALFLMPCLYLFFTRRSGTGPDISESQQGLL